ncbi:hypothetical protein DID80_00910 [Candidatus Marinamargulisbacteria bacterium SCGC AAA071-K20]|nr:hypothetical protein DID80_00910 [Candidatus Marinamargulisbacteria bacterium SCGC AAA071-K20]
MNNSNDFLTSPQKNKLSRLLRICEENRAMGLNYKYLGEFLMLICNAKLEESKNEYKKSEVVEIVFRILENYKGLKRYGDPLEKQISLESTLRLLKKGVRQPLNSLERTQVERGLKGGLIVRQKELV